MIAEGGDSRLVVEVRNGDPIELSDLTASLQSLARQYQRFSARAGFLSEGQAKLYVGEVRSGSVTATLVPYVALAAPVVAHGREFMELAENLIGFARYLQTAFEWLIGRGEASTDREYTVSDLREISQILDVTAKDHNGSFNINAYDKANVQVTINYSTIEANAIQNGAAREIVSRQAPDQTLFEKVLMYWHTASRSTKAKSGDKAVIEKISERPLPVFIADEVLKQKMIAGKDNPFLVGFIVDVELITVQGRLRGYCVLRLYEEVEDAPDDIGTDG